VSFAVSLKGAQSGLIADSRPIQKSTQFAKTTSLQGSLGFYISGPLARSTTLERSRSVDQSLQIPIGGLTQLELSNIIESTDPLIRSLPRRKSTEFAISNQPNTSIPVAASLQVALSGPIDGSTQAEFSNIIESTGVLARSLRIYQSNHFAMSGQQRPSERLQSTRDFRESLMSPPTAFRQSESNDASHLLIKSDESAQSMDFAASSVVDQSETLEESRTTLQSVDFTESSNPTTWKIQNTRQPARSQVFKYTARCQKSESLSDSIATCESQSVDESKGWSSQDLLQTERTDSSHEFCQTVSTDVTLPVDVTQEIVESPLFVHSLTAVLSSQHGQTEESLSIRFGVTSDPAVTGAQDQSNAIQLSVDFIASETEPKSQVFISGEYIRSNVFTGSVYFVDIDEQSEQTVGIARGSAAAGASVGVGLLGVAGLMLFLLKRQHSNGSDFDDPMGYDTDGRNVNVEEEEEGPEDSEDDDWDVDEFDRVIESTFVNGQERINAMHEFSDHLFPTDCDEIP
jgi:hypothetical protein